jgi:diguanylate cyclase (GGDEF)-like protein
MIGLTVLVVQLGRMNESFSNYYYLILLPVIWTSVSWGLGVGLLFAFSGNALALALHIFSGYSNYGVMEVQLMFAISIISAILIGLVHDQKNLFFKRSMFDELTGLANMRLFKEIASTAIARAHRNNEKSAFLFIDIDGFKSANDRFGHKAGDNLLREASSRIESCVRDADCLARFGGDEFVIYLDQTCAIGDAKVAQKIIQKMSERFNVKTQTETLGASIGVAIYPNDGTTVDTLIQNADMAMYVAKKKDKNDFRLYSASFPEMSCAD